MQNHHHSGIIRQLLRHVTSSPHDMIRTSSLVVVAFIFSELRLCVCVCVCVWGGGGSKLNGVKRHINEASGSITGDTRQKDLLVSFVWRIR